MEFEIGSYVSHEEFPRYDVIRFSVKGQTSTEMFVKHLKERIIYICLVATSTTFQILRMKFF